VIKCANCGAEVSPTAEKCGYCSTTTAYGVQLAQQRDHHGRQQAQWQQQQQLHEQQMQRGKASQSLYSDASHALWWSIAGLVICCSPASIIGLVLALRSRKLAAKHALLIPGRATLALVLSSLGLLGSVLVIGWVVMDEMRLDSARERVSKVVDKGAGAERIDQKTACAIVELELLENGYQGNTGSLIDNFKCTGKLEQEGDRAHLDLVRFKANAVKVERVACLRKGGRWDFLDFRDLDESCEGKSRTQLLVDEAAAKASGGGAAPSATTSAAAAPSTAAPSASATP
jgi:hypothetical protein